MLLEIAHPSETFVHQLPSGGLSGAFLSLVSLSLLLLCCSPTHQFDLNCFISADSLFVLSNPFISCQINSHRLIKPSESVVGAAVPWPSLWWLTQLG